MRCIWVVSALFLILTTACGGSSKGNAAGKATTAAQANAAIVATNTVPAAAQSALATCAKDPRCAAGQEAVAAAGKKACTLITQAEAAAALGKAVGPGTVRGTSCTYEDPETAYSVVIDLKPSTGGSAGAKGLFNAAHKAAPGGLTTTDDVSGLGDSAFIWSGLASIHVLSGQTYFSIQMVNDTASSNTTASLRPALIELARKALTRI